MWAMPKNLTFFKIIFVWFIYFNFFFFKKCYLYFLLIIWDKEARKLLKESNINITYAYREFEKNICVLTFYKHPVTGSEFLPWLVVSKAMETNCGAVHPFSARGEHEEAEQHRVQYGGVWGGVQSTALHPRHLFSPPTKNGRLLQETTDYPWGRQFYFLEQVKFVLLVCFLKVVKTL